MLHSSRVRLAEMTGRRMLLFNNATFQVSFCSPGRCTAGIVPRRLEYISSDNAVNFVKLFSMDALPGFTRYT